MAYRTRAQLAKVISLERLPEEHIPRFGVRSPGWVMSDAKSGERLGYARRNFITQAWNVTLGDRPEFVVRRLSDAMEEAAKCLTP